MNDERSIADVEQTNQRDDALYQQWADQAGHDPGQPLTNEEWKDFYQTWSRENQEPFDPEQAEANPFTQDMQLQELDPDTPPLSELVQENDLELDREYLQELDAQGLLQDDIQIDTDPTLLEPSKTLPFEDRDRDFGR